MELIEKYLPNVLENIVELQESVLETITMVAISGVISLAIGIVFG